MKKTIKTFILIFTFILCVSLIGGAYALYVKNADSLEISFSAEQVIPWAPVDGGYYIVGEMSSWGVNENAILLDKNVTGTTDKAAIESVHLAVGQKFKVIRYTIAGGIDWKAVSYNASSIGVTVNSDSDGNVKVNATDNYFVCVNKDNQVWIQPVSTV